MHPHPSSLARTLGWLHQAHLASALGTLWASLPFSLRDTWVWPSLHTLSRDQPQTEKRAVHKADTPQTEKRAVRKADQPQTEKRAVHKADTPQAKKHTGDKAFLHHGPHILLNSLFHVSVFLSLKLNGLASPSKALLDASPRGAPLGKVCAEHKPLLVPSVSQQSRSPAQRDITSAVHQHCSWQSSLNNISIYIYTWYADNNKKGLWVSLSCLEPD